MLGTLKKGATNFILGLKGFFDSPESKIYVKDSREVVTCNDGRKCQYPKNYDNIVESGRIKETKGDDGNIKKDIKGKPLFDLSYQGKLFLLALVRECEDKQYFTIDALIDPKNKNINNLEGYHEPFGFSRMDLNKHIPIFEVKENNGKLELVNSSLLKKKIKDNQGKIQEIDDTKGRNRELLYTAYYKPLNPYFLAIRDHNRNLEFDKSILVSVPIIFATALAKICSKCFTSFPIKLGEYLINKQNPIAKAFGYCLFTPATIVKNLVNVGSVIAKVPILLFVANKEKYGDKHFTALKYQFKMCVNEIKNDYRVFNGRERLEPEEKKNHHKAGTWKELDAIKPDLEKELNKSKSSEVISHSKSNEKTLDSSETIDQIPKGEHVKKVENDRGKLQSNGQVNVK